MSAGLIVTLVLTFLAVVALATGLGFVARGLFPIGLAFWRSFVELWNEGIGSDIKDLLDSYKRAEEEDDKEVIERFRIFKALVIGVLLVGVATVLGFCALIASAFALSTPVG